MGALIFLLLFLAIPLAELYFLIAVGARIGALPTIGLCILTAVVGGILVRWQGLEVVGRVSAALQRRELPALEMLEGAALLLAGVMLMFPGFFSDILGFLLLIPPLRRAAVLAFLRRRGILDAHAEVHVYRDGQGVHRVIDVEAQPDREPGEPAPPRGRD